MKIFISFWLFLSVFFSMRAQNDTVWTKCIGGSSYEVVGAFEQSQALVKTLPDSTFILISSTYSSNGIMSSSHGSTDVFMAKMTYSGDTVWTKLIGGPDIDVPTGIDVDAVGNIAICGYTYSTTGDLYGHHGDSLEPDGFIALYDLNGNKTWAYQYGGSDAAGIPGSDYLYDVHFSTNGDIIAAGTTTSVNGDLSFIVDVYSCGWFVKVNQFGTINKSSKVYGANHTNENSNDLTRIVPLPNGHFIGLGFQWYMLSSKLWLVEFDTYGNITWEKEYSPAYSDAYAVDLEKTADGNLLALAYINGSGGDVDTTYNGGYSDAWVFISDTAGNIIDQQCFGGSAGELPYRLEPIGNEYLMLGSSSSTDGFVHGDSLGSSNFWMLRFNLNLDTTFTMQFGGSQADALISAIPLSNNEYIIAGKTESNDHWVHGNNGAEDIFLARVSCIPTGIHTYQAYESVLVYPNPANDIIKTDLLKGDVQYEIFDYSGKLVDKGKCEGHINIANLSSGFYLLRVLDEEKGWRPASFVKE